MAVESTSREKRNTKHKVRLVSNTVKVMIGLKYHVLFVRCILAPNSNVNVSVKTIHVVSKLNLFVPQVFQHTFLDTEASSL